MQYWICEKHLCYIVFFCLSRLMCFKHRQSRTCLKLTLPVYVRVHPLSFQVVKERISRIPEDTFSGLSLVKRTQNCYRLSTNAMRVVVTSGFVTRAKIMRGKKHIYLPYRGQIPLWLYPVPLRLVSTFLHNYVGRVEISCRLFTTRFFLVFLCSYIVKKEIFHAQFKKSNLLQYKAHKKPHIKH